MYKNKNKYTHTSSNKISMYRMNLQSFTIVALIAVSLISVGIIQQSALAQEDGMAIRATSSEGSDTITVTGKTYSDFTDVIFKVTSPDGTKVVEIGQATPDENGDFSLDIKTSMWKESGFYTILAKQGQSSFYTLDLEVQVVDGATKQTDERSTNLSTDIFADADIPQNIGLVLDPIMIEIGTTEFEVVGYTDKIEQSVTITVTSPENGNVVEIAQVAPDLDGKFTANISVGPLWKEDGYYMVTAQQTTEPEYTDSTQIEILDGVIVPEFGAIAMLILAVAVVSIIIVSTRTRLRIIPRY